MLVHVPVNVQGKIDILRFYNIPATHLRETVDNRIFFLSNQDQPVHYIAINKCTFCGKFVVYHTTRNPDDLLMHRLTITNNHCVCANPCLSVECGR